MGLAERKSIAEFKELSFKAFEAKISKAMGKSLEISFDWDILENHPDFDWIMANNRVEDLFFNRVLEAITNICNDKMGLEAAQSCLKSIVMVPKGSSLSFTGGKFEMFFELAGEGAWSVQDIQKCLEKGM